MDRRYRVRRPLERGVFAFLTVVSFLPGCGGRVGPGEAVRDRGVVSEELRRYWEIVEASRNRLPPPARDRMRRESIEACKAFIRDFPDSKMAYGMHLNVVNLHSVFGEWPQVADHCHIVLQKNPTHPGSDIFRWHLGRALLQIEWREAEGVATLEELIRRDMFRELSCPLLAEHWEKRGDAARAAAAREKAGEAPPAQKIRMLQRDGKHAEAVELASELLEGEKLPTHRREECLLAQGISLIEIGRSAEGLSAVETVARQGTGRDLGSVPIRYKACERLVSYWEQREDPEKARYWLEEAKKTMEGSPATIQDLDRRLEALGRSQRHDTPSRR